MVKLLDFAGQEAELEKDSNPFAVVVLAHLKAREPPAIVPGAVSGNSGSSRACTTAVGSTTTSVNC